MRYLDERQFHQQAFVRRLSVVDVALVHQLQRLIEERGGALLGLCLITFALLVADFQQRQCLWVLRHQHIAHMLGQSLNEQSTIETLVDNLVEQHHDVCHLINNREVDNLEVVLRIEHVQVLNHFLIRDVALTE